MILHQLSVFLENKPHQLRIPIKHLAQAGIDILTLSLADTEQFGILRLIVNDWEKARRTLEETGCVVKVTEVVAIEVPDHPGGLDSVLDAMNSVDLSIEYLYSCTFRRNNSAVLIFRLDQESPEAIDRLRRIGLNVLDQSDVYNRGTA